MVISAKFSLYSSPLGVCSLGLLHQVSESTAIPLQMDTNGKEAYVSNANLPESISSGGNVMQAIRSACEVLKRVESSEKLANDHMKRTESTKLNEHLLAEANTLRANLLEAVNKLVLFDSEAFTLSEKLCFQEKQLSESDHQLTNTREKNQDLLHKRHEMSCTPNDLKVRISRAESRADSAEVKCKLLPESNIELSEELNLLKGSGNTSEKVDLLERQMSESDIALQSAVASSEASREKQCIISYTVKDLENVIEELKLKVSKAENLAESAEDEYTILSECNSDLAEELRCLRGRMDCLKASLHEAKESKKATGNKLIADLVINQALENEQKQEVKQSQQTSNSDVDISYNVKVDVDNSTSTRSMGKSGRVNMEKKDEPDMGVADKGWNFNGVRNTEILIHLVFFIFRQLCYFYKQTWSPEKMIILLIIFLR